MADLKPVFKKENGEWIKKDAFQKISGQWQQISAVQRDVTYGVKIDIANSDPETALTYTDDAVGFTGSYMDFTNDAFVWGSWEDKFPFNQIKPCYMENGVVTKYLNPNNYAEDVDGNPVDITSAGAGDVMIEIPKIYYYLHKDANYQYIQISNFAQEGFCCLAHTYKGVEKDKVYIGAYKSYRNGGMRSISGKIPTGKTSLDNWRTYAHNKGFGYECFYWNLLVLLQSLFVIQFKNLNSVAVMGKGCTSTSEFFNTGSLNTKGMNYCASSSESSEVKWLGMEGFWGIKTTFIDGVYTNGTTLTIADATKTNMEFSGTGVGYKTVVSSFPQNEGHLSRIQGTNETGFTSSSVDGTSTTYYCSPVINNTNRICLYGNATAFQIYLTYPATNGTQTHMTTRLAYCG